MTANGLGLVPPGPGRRYSTSCLVRLGDVLPSGEVRLDAVARYLQDIAYDDGLDAGIESDLFWLVRKTILGFARRPRVNERLDLMTWASGHGARWAERRTTISLAGEAIVESASLWVCVDVKTMRPARLPDHFWTMYGEAVGHRVVSSRLHHPDTPAASTALTTPRPWPLRVTDLDVLGHVNNAVTWAAVEDELDRIGVAGRLVRAELEYREPIDRSHDISVASQASGDNVHVWLSAGGTVLASAALTFE